MRIEIKISKLTHIQLNKRTALQLGLKSMFSPNQVQTQDLASSNGGPVLPSVQVATWEAISLAHCGKAHPNCNTNANQRPLPQDLAYLGHTSLAALTSAAGKEAQKEVPESESLSQCVDIPTNSSVTESAVSTNFVQASRFAEDVYAMQQAMQESEDPDMNAMNFKMRSLVDMTTLAEHLLDQQDIYRGTTSSTAPAVDNNGGGGEYIPGPTHVDIGYIYTDKPSLDLLLEDGLVTQATVATGARLGTGIYTANNAFAGHPNNYFSAETESVGLLVARLRGSQTSKNGVDPDTVVGRRNRPDEVVVLRSTCQCLPLVHFMSPLIELCDDRSLGNDMVYQYHCQLQGIIDECFNGGRTTPVPRVFAMQVIPALPQLVPS
jgi:hypothetical protein